MSIKIALVQFEPKVLDAEANFSYAEKEIRKAAADGALLAVLPEYHLTSWVAEEPEFRAYCASSAVFLARYQDLAREANISIVPGTIVKAYSTDPAHAAEDGSPTAVTKFKEGDENVEFRNMASFIAAGSGEVIASYQKANLWHPERPLLTAPTKKATSSSGGSTVVDLPLHAAFDTPWKWGAADPENPDRPVRAGMLVCWDLAFPEGFRALVADGADLIIVPSFWSAADCGPEAAAFNPDCEKLFLQSTLVARAFEGTCAVAFCNSGGVSQLAMPITGSQGVVEPGENRTSLVTVDLNLLRISEEVYRPRADMKKPDWHYAHTILKRET